MPAKRGDGTSLDVTGILEARRGDGTKLFSAVPEDLIDNFEPILYEDQNRTLSDYYSGSVSEVTRQQSTVLEGNNALEIDTTNDPFISSNNLPRIPEYASLRIRVRFYMDSLEEFVFFFNGSSEVSSKSDWIGYSASVSADTDELGITVYEDQNKSSVGTGSSISISTGKWYAMNIDLDTDGTISVTVFDISTSDVVGSTSGTDTTHAKDSGAIGFAGIGFNDGIIYADRAAFI